MIDENNFILLSSKSDVLKGGDDKGIWILI